MVYSATDHGGALGLIAQPSARYDLVIVNGAIVDGTGNRGTARTSAFRTGTMTVSY